MRQNSSHVTRLEDANRDVYIEPKKWIITFDCTFGRCCRSWSYLCFTVSLGVFARNVSVRNKVAEVEYIQSRNIYTLYIHLFTTVVGYWYGYLSGATCKWFAYCPADAIAIPSSLAPDSSKIQNNGLSFWYRLTQVVHLSWKKAVKRMQCSSSYYNSMTSASQLSHQRHRNDIVRVILTTPS